MDEKFSLIDIAQLLAEQAGIEPSKSEKFINELVELINEGIRKDGIVKVKSFGTFRIILVKERESVHVNTGERIIIPAHHKLSFKPDYDLKELINKPFSIFETIEDTSVFINNITETSLLSENNIFGKNKAEGFEEQQITDDELFEDDLDDILFENDKEGNDTAPPTITPISQRQEDMPPPMEGDDKPESTITNKEAEPPQVNNIRKDDVEQQPTQTKKTKQKTSSRHKKESSLFPLYIILGVLIFICAGCAWYYFAYSRSFDSFSKNYDTKVSTEFSLPNDLTAETLGDSSVLPEDSLEVKADIDSITKKDMSQPSATPPSNDGTSAQKPAIKPSTSKNSSTLTSSGGTNKVLAKITMSSGSRLTLLAQKYYGNKIFWVYIYDYNKEKIGTNPDNVKSGMELLIPAKEIYGIDANSADSREKARKLQTQLMSGKR